MALQEDARVRIVLEGAEEGGAAIENLLGKRRGGGPGAASGGGGGGSGPSGSGDATGAALGALAPALKQLIVPLTTVAAIVEPLHSLVALLTTLTFPLQALLEMFIPTEGRAKMTARGQLQQFARETYGQASEEQMDAMRDHFLDLARRQERGAERARERIAVGVAQDVFKGLGLGWMIHR